MDIYVRAISEFQQRKLKGMKSRWCSEGLQTLKLYIEEKWGGLGSGVTYPFSFGCECLDLLSYCWSIYKLYYHCKRIGRLIRCLIICNIGSWYPYQQRIKQVRVNTYGVDLAWIHRTSWEFLIFPPNKIQ